MKLLAVAFLFPIFLSCGQAGFEQISEAITQATGLPVVNNSVEHDQCTMEQLKQIGSEFKSMNQADRDDLLNNVKTNYEKIVIERSKIAEKQSGKLISLVFFELLCSDDNCWYEEQSRKVIQDDREIEGERKASVIQKADKTLVLETYSSMISYESIEMMTTNEGLYEKIDSTEDPIYNDALDKKVVYHRRTKAMNKLECKSAKDLLLSIKKS